MTLLLRDRIAHLRVRAPAQRRAAEVAAALGNAELHPPGLPRGAIVFIRHLAIPRDRAQTSAASAAYWREAARSQIAERLREAARPILGAVPAACEAVLFADDAELLACLARDWLDGALRQRWWWRESFPASELAQVLAAMRRAPTALPAMFALLAREDRALTVAQRLPRAAAIELLGLLAAVSSEAARERVADSLQAPREAVTTAGDSQLAARLVEAALRAHNPFRAPPQLVANADAPDAASALSVGDASVAAPGLTISPGAAAELAAPFASSFAANPVAMSMSRSPNRSARDGPPPMDEARAIAPSANPIPQAEAGLATAALPAGDATGDPSLQQALNEDTPFAAAAPASESISPIASKVRAATGDAATKAGEINSHAPGIQQVQTAFGGLFYLLNLALYLELYGDFTQPRQPSLALSPWDLLALLGRHWFGPRLLADPLWPLLARLADRDRDAEPGAGFVPPSDWVVPASWLAAFDAAGSLIAQRCGRRARLRHPAGFWLFDVDIAEDSRVPLGTLADAKPRALPWRPARARTNETANQRWLANLIRYLEARCALALGVTRREVAATICGQAALLLLTPSTLEVRLALNALPLPIRYAGLDRDPGWLPAAGRSIRFVFD